MKANLIPIKHPSLSSLCYLPRYWTNPHPNDVVYLRVHELLDPFAFIPFNIPPFLISVCKSNLSKLKPFLPLFLPICLYLNLCWSLSLTVLCLEMLSLRELTDLSILPPYLSCLRCFVYSKTVSS